VAVNLPGTDRERPNWRRRLPAGAEALVALPRAEAILAALRAARPDWQGLRTRGTVRAASP
jgi:4-alpha-glucanotransferase